MNKFIRYITLHSVTQQFFFVGWLRSDFFGSLHGSSPQPGAPQRPEAGSLKSPPWDRARDADIATLPRDERDERHGEMSIAGGWPWPWGECVPGKELVHVSLLVMVGLDYSVSFRVFVFNQPFDQGLYENESHVVRGDGFSLVKNFPRIRRLSHVPHIVEVVQELWSTLHCAHAHEEHEFWYVSDHRLVTSRSILSWYLPCSWDSRFPLLSSLQPELRILASHSMMRPSEADSTLRSQVSAHEQQYFFFFLLPECNTPRIAQTFFFSHTCVTLHENPQNHCSACCVSSGPYPYFPNQPF